MHPVRNVDQGFGQWSAYQGYFFHYYQSLFALCYAAYKVRFGICRYATGSNATNGTSNANNRLILKYHKNVMKIEYASKKCIV